MTFRERFLERLRQRGSHAALATHRVTSITEEDRASLARQMDAVRADNVDAEILLEGIAVASDLEIHRNFFGWEYIEILRVSDAAIDMEWLRSGNAPSHWYSHWATMSHGAAGHIANMVNPRVERRGGHNALVVDFVFYPNRPRSREALDDIRAGLTRNVSVGWSALDDDVEVVERDDVRRIIYHRWNPGEVTWCSTPADRDGSGMGRNGDDDFGNHNDAGFPRTGEQAMRFLNSLFRSGGFNLLDRPNPDNPPTPRGAPPTPPSGNGDGVRIPVARTRSAEAMLRSRGVSDEDIAALMERVDRGEFDSEAAFSDAVMTACERGSGSPAPSPTPNGNGNSVRIPVARMRSAEEMLRGAGVADEALAALTARVDNGEFRSVAAFSDEVLDMVGRAEAAGQPSPAPRQRVRAVGERVSLGALVQQIARNENWQSQRTPEARFLVGEVEGGRGDFNSAESNSPGIGVSVRFLVHADPSIRRRVIQGLHLRGREDLVDMVRADTTLEAGTGQGGLFTPELYGELIMALYAMPNVFGTLRVLPEMLDRDLRLPEQKGVNRGTLVDEDGSVASNANAITVNTAVDLKPSTSVASHALTNRSMTQAPVVGMLVRDLLVGQTVPLNQNDAILGLLTSGSTVQPGFLKHCAAAANTGNRQSFGTAYGSSNAGAIPSYARLRKLIDQMEHNNLPGAVYVAGNSRVASAMMQIARPVTQDASNNPAILSNRGMMSPGGMGMPMRDIDGTPFITDNNIPTDFTGNLASNAFTRDTSTGTLTALFAYVPEQIMVGFFSGVDLLVDPYSVSVEQKTRMIVSQTWGAALCYPEAVICAADVKPATA